MENASRFVNAYNTIDITLRNVHGFKANMTFSDIVRRCVSDNYIIRMYEDDLIAFARLRNAIVHRSLEDKVIAEPHTDVVELIEKIARLVSTPPTALQSVCGGKVATIRCDTILKEVIVMMGKMHYSNVPVYDNEKMIGVASSKALIECIGERLLSGSVGIEKFISTTRVAEILEPAGFDLYYTILPSTATLSDVLNCFQKNRRLRAVIITKNGSDIEQPLGIITPVDILEINNILDSY